MSHRVSSSFLASHRVSSHLISSQLISSPHISTPLLSRLIIMLGWEVESAVSEIESCTLDLIDHIVSGNIGTNRAAETSSAATTTASHTRLTWDGRKGQWIPLAYSFAFPKGPFDQTVKSVDGGVQCRPLAAFSFPPCKRHAMMLDQGSPKLRVVPRSTLKGRHVSNIPGNGSALPQSPLSSSRLRRPTRARSGEEESEDECRPSSAWESYDPFNLPSRPVQPITWLDDINIEDFLSSAIDYQADGGPLNSEPSKVGKRASPCTPSSPPPPLFSFPDFRISPPKFSLTPR